MIINLENKVALVTGGSRGIGRSIVEILGKAKARVAFTYKSSEMKAKTFIDHLHKSDINAIAIKADAASKKESEESVQKTVDAFGGLHILVCNAGITRDGLLIRMMESDWDDVITSNLKSVFNYVKASLIHMTKQRYGRIITLSSVVGLTGNAGQANYAASKSGIIGFTKSIAKEVGSRNILANAVVPGLIETEMTENLNEDQKKSFFSKLPLRRTGIPDDVAKTVLFLSSDLSSYITGETIRVDGGFAI